MVDKVTRAISQCSGKYRFSSYTRALSVARRRGRRQDSSYVPYACPTCGGFHVGTNSRHVDIPRRIDPRQGYRVYARDPRGRVVMVGWSSQADGGQVAQFVRADGWEIDSVVAHHRTKRRGPR